MRNTKSCFATLVTILFSMMASNVNSNADETIDPRVNESRQMVKAFGKQLVTELKQGLQEGGPENAIQVCRLKAPTIAASLSDQYQWDIGRTSLKTRNSNNKADVWEQAVLQQFEQRKQQGEDVAKLEYFEDTEQGFRYMKAIPTKGLCLTCHGSEINESLQTTLKKHYPDDQATGFKAGDIRGAFTLRQR